MKTIEDTRHILGKIASDHQMLNEAFWTGHAKGYVDLAQELARAWITKWNGQDIDGFAKFIATHMNDKIAQARKDEDARRSTKGP